ncbi:MAG: Mth938-like domain-containing protein [Alphaproteobacteria bacterium]|nr:Mth938-like domain-containing protein [Alphaproteobacteria bacterium]
MPVGPTPTQSGRKLIERYGGGGFRVSGEAFRGSILLCAGFALAWPASDIAAATAESIAPILEADPSIELVLLGCGARLVPTPATLRAALKARGVGVEPMDTGAACRTFNVLTAEDRRVAAALIAV